MTYLKNGFLATSETQVKKELVECIIHGNNRYNNIE